MGVEEEAMARADQREREAGRANQANELAMQMAEMLRAAGAVLADRVGHWAECPLPPDAGCTACHEFEHARRVLAGTGRGPARLPDRMLCKSELKWNSDAMCWETHTIEQRPGVSLYDLVASTPAGSIYEPWAYRGHLEEKVHGRIVPRTDTGPHDPLWVALEEQRLAAERALAEYKDTEALAAARAERDEVAS